MSAGDFSNTKYELSLITGQIWRIRVQEEALGLTFDDAPNPDIVNTAPAGNITAQVSVKVNKGNREFGVRPRYFVLEWDSAPPTGYTGEEIRVPILQEAIYDSVDIGQAGTYNGTAVRVKAKVPEQSK